MNQPILLAVDTSTARCSVALFQGGVFHSGQSILAGTSHTKKLLPMIDEILQAANCAVPEIDAVAYSRGPGSFTGLRISASMLQALAFAYDKPAICVSSLEALALQAYEQLQSQDVLAIIDARKGEFYWSHVQFDAQGTLKAIALDQLTSPQVLIDYIDNQPQGLQCIGGGLNALPEASHIALHEALPEAREVGQLACLALTQGQVVEASEIQPVYVRNDVAYQN